MSSLSSSSEHKDFNFNHSPTGPLSSGHSSESDNSLDFTPFDISLHQIIFYLILLFMRMIKFSWGLVRRNLFLCHFTKTHLVKACPLMLKACFLWAYLLLVLLDTDTDDSFWELSTNQSTIKKRKKAKRTTSRSTREKMRKEIMNRGWGDEDDKSAYDGDDDED